MTDIPSPAPRPTITTTAPNDETAPELPCHRCGYDLRAQPPDGICPECQASVAESRRVAAIPLRPAWRDSDPRWRRRILAGLWVLVLLPLLDVLQAFHLSARIPLPTILPAQGHFTLDDTFLTWPGVYQPLIFCTGVVLLFARERHRRRNPLDWTRRWGVLCTYVVLLLSAAQVLFISALVLAGIAALLVSMPRLYQPRVTQLFVNLSTAYLRYGAYPKTITAVILVVFSSITMLLACVALFDAVRSAGPKRAAAALLAPLALFALFHLAQAADYCVRFGSAPMAGFAHYGAYFWPALLANRLAHAPLPRGTSDPGPIAALAEAAKWLTILAIATWLTVAQRAARRPRNG